MRFCDIFVGVQEFRLQFKSIEVLFSSQLWGELFIRHWNSPPRFTTMHRSGIARVIGDEIILDGTTIEEVRDYHRETLKLCVEKSNQEEKAFLLKVKQQKEHEDKRIEEHNANIRNMTEGMEF